MGQALLVKRVDNGDDVPVVATHCTVLVTVKTQGGRALSNVNVTYKDGSLSGIYKTNSAGKTYFMVNSGMVNINGENIYVDLAPNNMTNFEAPVATIKKYTLWYNRTSKTTITANRSIKFSPDISNVNVEVYGGGGAGGSTGDGWSDAAGAGGGGGGYRTVKTVTPTINQSYSIVIGAGGKTDRDSGESRPTSRGNSGGTTSALEVTAAGGEGGWDINSGNAAVAAKGGTGNGGSSTARAENSKYTYGGGGGFGDWGSGRSPSSNYYGTPNGGYLWVTTNTDYQSWPSAWSYREAGIAGGGAGGLRYYHKNDRYYGLNGGSGACILTYNYK